MKWKDWELTNLTPLGTRPIFEGGGRLDIWNIKNCHILMFLRNVVDEARNHDFVMQSSIGSETKHFYTNGHLRQPTPFSGECWMWPNQRIWQMAQFCIQHLFRLEVYQIFFKKSFLHQKTLIFLIHHLFFFWLLGGSKWVWSSKKPVSRWIRFGV